jgi:hypothetical protein
LDWKKNLARYICPTINLHLIERGKRNNKKIGQLENYIIIKE